MKIQKIPFSSLLILFLLLLAPACAGPADGPPSSRTADPAGGSTQNASPGKPAFTDLNRDTYSSYSSKFEVRFDGPQPWRYELQTRRSPALREFNLHMEGFDRAANPGDVRIVTDGKTSWMIGPGTDEQCVQFPNNQGMDPTLLFPDMLVPNKNLAALLAYQGEESIGGIAALHYSGSAPAVGDWKDAQIDIWQDKAGRGLLRFTMQASGADPFFGKGAGKLTAQYEASALDVAEIAPVQGCEISVPLPDSAAMFVRLPGLASFESPAGLEEMRKFYQTRLAQGNWSEKEPPEQGDGVVVLSYQRDGEAVEIQIETVTGGGTKVKLIFLEEK